MAGRHLAFFDTSALIHRYVDSDYSRRVRRIVSDRRYQCHVAELTVLEMASALSKQCRIGNLEEKAYDRWDLQFFQDINAKRLRVREHGTRSVMRARNLIRFAGVVRRRRLKGADALIAATGLELALDEGQRIAFYTSDWGLYSIVRDVSAFTAAMTLRYLGTPKGGIPAET